MWPYIPKSCDEKKTFFSPTLFFPLGEVTGDDLLPRSALAFFVACLLLGIGRVYKVQIV